MKSKVYILLCLLVLGGRLSAQNNPYVDDKLIHFGFSLGVNMMAYHVSEASLKQDDQVYHVRQSSYLPGFSVGFITDLRLSRHLNLRFVPGLSFASRTLSYRLGDSDDVHGLLGAGNQVEVLCIPISLPLQLKWSAERENNYRPYVMVGGGASYNVFPDIRKPVAQMGWDAFIEAGVGVDLYFRWFKFCPEIKYQIGFLNQLMPVEQHTDLPEAHFFYTNSIRRLTNHSIVLVFNFE